MSRYDIVLYGVTGFAGKYMLKGLLNNENAKGITFAVAGRNEGKIRKVLEEVSSETGIDIRSTSIIIASTDDVDSLNSMAKQATVLINAVGPYRNHGEVAVKAAIENGACHLDISGESEYLEGMARKYNDLARAKGVYIVGACGFDSIPCDLGVNYLKLHFEGDLNHVETFIQTHTGASGYTLNAGTYQSLVLGVGDKIKRFRQQREYSKAIMPEEIVKGTVKPPKRFPAWKIRKDQLDGWALPFLGSDKEIVNRSQYYDFTVRKERAAHVETYFRVSNFIYAYGIGLWFAFFAIMAQFSPTKKLLLKYPERMSFGVFSNAGPTEEQIRDTHFTYWFFGTGYSEKLPLDQQHEGKPDKKVVVTCKGPDMGYMATSGCILASALTLLKDREHLPKEGGVYTTAAAFGKTKIYDLMASYGVNFQVEK